jgi:hypothetical protein
MSADVWRPAVVADADPLAPLRSRTGYALIATTVLSSGVGCALPVTDSAAT